MEEKEEERETGRERERERKNNRGGDIAQFEGTLLRKGSSNGILSSTTPKGKLLDMLIGDRFPSHAKDLACTIGLTVTYTEWVFVTQLKLTRSLSDLLGHFEGFSDSLGRAALVMGIEAVTIVQVLNQQLAWTEGAAA
ncbi:hypothetical protein Syun_006855 [Stephania yunnanensis]|uniref:Uncharacterized protein n=1 Tax=Stephania yunnanensis TaxID=152371 RepID=A0AAP0L0T4_9MAGN